MKLILRNSIIAFSQIIFVPVVFCFLPVRILRKIFFRKRFLSLWVGTPIINMAHNARAERLLGVSSYSVVFDTYFITNDFDFNLSRISRSFPLRVLMQNLVFLLSTVLADRVHGYTDRLILPCYKKYFPNIVEMIIYKLYGIELVFWTYGADVRTEKSTRALGSPNMCEVCEARYANCICDDGLMADKEELIHKYAKMFISMGDMSEYAKDSVSDLYFWPIDLENTKYSPVYPNPSEKIVIGHAPNHRHLKGSEYLISAVNSLKFKGCNVELLLIEGVPNKEALEMYKTCDIIFDQCIIGFHGYFALEGMALGKPVMCYIRKPHEYLLNHTECPIINVEYNTIEEILQQLLSDKAQLVRIGEESRKYIEKYHSYNAFAERLYELYKSRGLRI
jgi:glycosyltransferase involved in cell wall biosynthesis